MKTLTLLRKAQLYETNATEMEQNGIKTRKPQRYYKPVAEPQIFYLLPPSISSCEAYGEKERRGLGLGATREGGEISNLLYERFPKLGAPPTVVLVCFAHWVDTYL
jgi:hypothetical protein